MPTPLLSALLDRWVEVWGLSRGVAPERTSYGWIVPVANTTRTVEHFVVSPTATQLAHLAHLAGGRSDAWVTVLGDLPTTRTDGLTAITRAERLMVAELVPRMLPLGIEIESGHGVAKAAAMVANTTAARGQVAVRGNDAVFDRIQTEPDFRRRGLAAHVMAGLEHWAVEQGASHGLLLASAEGRPLYTRLGWREVAPVMTFCGTPSRPT